MQNLDMPVEDLIDALRLTVGEGAGPDRAAVDLLAQDRGWLLRADFGECVEVFHDSETGETWARIQWDRVTTHLDQGRFTASASELSVLRIAASLGNGHLVDLRAAMMRVAPLTSAAVVDALVCAARVGDQVLVTRSPEVARRHLD